VKPNSSGRGWLHIDPGQCESGLTLTTNVDIGRIQDLRGKGPRSVSGLLHVKQPTLQSISVVVTLLPVVIPRAILDVLKLDGLQDRT